MAKSKKEIQKDYEKRTGYAAQKKYLSDKVVQVSIKFHKEKDADILNKLDDSRPYATQIKELLRK